MAAEMSSYNSISRIDRSQLRIATGSALVPRPVLKAPVAFSSPVPCARVAVDVWPGHGTSRGHVTCSALSDADMSPSQGPGPSSPSPDAQDNNNGMECSSALVNEEIVCFIFQLDLDTQLQRALNYEAYEQAQAIRNKRQRVDEALESMRERKASNIGAGTGTGEATLSVADVAAEGLRLRTAMARAVEKEDYKEAATIRDMLATLEAQSIRSQALQEQTAGGAFFLPKFRLGQRVVHRQYGFRGVVAGWDARCCETEDWLALQGGYGGGGVSERDAMQPHYHILVDQSDWTYDSLQPPVAYIAQEMCWAPEFGGQVPSGPAREAIAAAPGNPPWNPDGPKGRGPVYLPEGTSWVEAFGPEPHSHPYMYILFLGQDGRGDYVPCRQLRDKYKVKRRDVRRPGDEEGRR